MSVSIAFTEEDFDKAGLKTVNKGGVTLLDISGTQIISEPSLNVTLMKGLIDYSPRVTGDATWSFSSELENLEFALTGPLTGEFEVEAVAGPESTFGPTEVTAIGPLEKSFIGYVGAVPVTGTASFSIVLGATATVLAQSTFTGGHEVTSPTGLVVCSPRIAIPTR